MQSRASVRSVPSDMKKLRHDKLKENLVAKIKADIIKGGGEALSENLVSHASKEVDRMLKSGKIHEADIAKLEQQLRKVQVKSTSKPDVTESKPAPSALLKEQQSRRQEMVTPSTPSGKSVGTTGVGDEWGLLQALEKQEHEEKERRRMEMEKARKQSTRGDLKSQMQDHKEAELQRKREEMEFAAAEAERVKAWREAERQKELARLEKNMKEKRIRDEQLEDVRRRREAEKEAKRASEAVTIEESQKRLQAERDRELQRRLNQKQEYVKVLEDNEFQREMKKETKRKQIEEDMRFQKMYNDLKDAEEASRQRALAEMAQKQKRRYEIGLQIQKTVSEKAAEDEGRAKREQDAKERRDAEAERAKLERQRQERELVKSTLAAQTAEKERLRKQAEAEAKAHAARVKQEAIDFEMKEMQRRKEQKEKNVAHRDLLEQQMRDNHLKKQYQTYVMSETERALNAQLLKKVAERGISPPVSPTKSLDVSSTKPW